MSVFSSVCLIKFQKFDNCNRFYLIGGGGSKTDMPDVVDKLYNIISYFNICPT